MVEIGPGLGTLTGALLEAGHTVYAVEMDRRMAESLAQRIPDSWASRFLLTIGDAVRHPRGNLPKDTVPYFIVANLPYAITSPWLDAVLEGGLPLPERMVLLVQKEAALRLQTPPGTPATGALTLFLQSAFKATGIHPVGKHCFLPPPEVDSCFIVWQKLPTPYFFSPRARKEIRHLFTQRRKQVLPVLRRRQEGAPLAGVLADLLRAEGITETARAEQLPVAIWQQWDKTCFST